MFGGGGGAKAARVMTVEEVKAEIEGDSEVSNGVKKLSLSEYPDVLDILSVHSSEWPSTIEALEKARIKNIDDLMLTARFVELNEAGTLEKLRKAGLGDATFLGKLRHFARRPGVKITTDDALPTTTTTAAAATTTTLDGTATPAGTTPSHSPPPRMTHAH